MSLPEVKDGARLWDGPSKGRAGTRLPYCCFPPRGRMWVEGKVSASVRNSAVQLPHTGPATKGSKGQPSALRELCHLRHLPFPAHTLKQDGCHIQ